MAITDKSSHSSVPSLKELALDALPVRHTVSSITNPQSSADDVVYDAYIGRLNSAANNVLPVAPEHLDRVAQALRATLAASVAARPSAFTAQDIHATRFAAIYTGLGESLRRHDEAVLERDKPSVNASAERLSLIRSVWFTVVEFCRWLLGMTAAKPDITPEQSRIYVRNLSLGNVEKMRFQLRFVESNYAIRVVRNVEVESDIRHLTPKPGENDSAAKIHDDVRELERALQHAVCSLVSRLKYVPGAGLEYSPQAAPLVNRIKDENAPIFVEMGKRPSDGMPFIQLVCEGKKNQMFLFDKPAMHPSRTGNLTDAEMLESLRKPPEAPRV